MNFSPVLSRDFLRLGRFSDLLIGSGRSAPFKTKLSEKDYISTQKVRITKYNFYLNEIWIKAYLGVILSLANAANKISSVGISEFFSPD